MWEKILESNTHTHSCLLAGAAESCGGATGKQQLHDPPLIFDLEHDAAEETPLEARTPEYQVVAERIARRREELLWDIATDQSVSTADYSMDESAEPCCDPRRAVCRCHPLGRGWELAGRNAHTKGRRWSKQMSANTHGSKYLLWMCSAVCL